MSANDDYKDVLACAIVTLFASAGAISALVAIYMLFTF